MKLYVIAGHGAGDPGAVGNGYTEAELTRALAARIAELGGDSVELMDTSRNWYQDGGISTYPFSYDAEIVEEHLNSASALNARGASIHLGTGHKPDNYDWRLVDAMCALMPGRANQIVNQSLGNATRAAARGISYRLVENGFITNAADCEFFLTHLDEIALAQLEAFGIEPVKAPARPNYPNHFPKGSEMFRLLNPYNGEHMYTTSETERTELEAVGWIYEGVAWEHAIAVPIYRLWTNANGHLFTTSDAEKDSLIASGWTFEGVEGYSYPEDGTPVYRLYNPVNYQHVYTADKNEVDSLIMDGWQDEGVAFYAK